MGELERYLKAHIHWWYQTHCHNEPSPPDQTGISHISKSQFPSAKTLGGKIWKSEWRVLNQMHHSSPNFFKPGLTIQSSWAKCLGHGNTIHLCLDPHVPWLNPTYHKLEDRKVTSLFYKHRHKIEKSPLCLGIETKSKQYSPQMILPPFLNCLPPSLEEEGIRYCGTNSGQET